MGCGASAVKEQPPQFGAVGSAASLAKWKRTHQSQPKLVECSLPTAIEKPNASDKEALEEVETNCGSLTDEAYSQTQSRPVSRESMVSASDSHLSEHEMKRRQLRLQMSKACALAAKSGDLMAALQQVRSQSQAPTTCNIAPPTAPPSSGHFSRKKKSPSKPSNEEQEPQLGNVDLDAIKRKAAAALFSNPGFVNGFLRDSTLAANDQAQKEDLIESSKRKLAAHLERCAEAGTLEKMLEESMEGASKPKSSEQISKDTSNDLEIVRQKAANILEASASSGLLEQIMVEKTKSDEDEQLRQKGASALIKAFSSGTLDNILAASMSKKADDNIVPAIQQRAASSLVNAARSGSLADAFSTIKARENARKALESACFNGSLEKMVTNSLQQTKETKVNEIENVEKIRQKAQASLQEFLRSAA